MNHWKEKIKIVHSSYKKLPVTYLQRKGFRSWMAYLSCSFGSVMPGFPDGSAHFLEHRLFTINGRDATELFSTLGADVNAFTSKRIMGFYFSTLRNPYESIQLLLDVVLKKRDFDAQAIENEKKIIESEIMMVEDDPFTKGYQNLLEQMYWEHPIRTQIAGTKESISSMDSSILTQIHTKYFNPLTCKLIICGGEEIEEFESTFKKRIHSSHWNKPQEIDPFYFYKEPLEVKTSFFEDSMPVSKDLLFIGFKTKKNKFTLTDSLIGEFICHIVFGSISPFIDLLYTKNYIDDTFYFSYDWDLDYGYLVVSGYSSHALKLKKEIEKECKKREKTGINQEEFTIIKNYFLGSSYMMIDKPSDLMMHLTNLAWLHNKTWEDYREAIENLTLQTVNESLSNFLSLDYSAVTLIHPS